MTFLLVKSSKLADFIAIWTRHAITTGIYINLNYKLTTKHLVKSLNTIRNIRQVSHVLFKADEERKKENGEEKRK